MNVGEKLLKAAQFFLCLVILSDLALNPQTQASHFRFRQTLLVYAFWFAEFSASDGFESSDIFALDRSYIYVSNIVEIEGSTSHSKEKENYEAISNFLCMGKFSMHEKLLRYFYRREHPIIQSRYKPTVLNFEPQF